MGDASHAQTALCVVTTGHERDSTLGPRAVDLAAVLRASGQLSCFVEREGQSLAKLMKIHSAAAVLVVGPGGTILRLENGSELRLNGGIGVLRLRNVLKGGRDNLVDACGLGPGKCSSTAPPPQPLQIHFFRTASCFTEQ